MTSLRNALGAQGIPGCPAGLRGLNSFYRESPAAERSFGFSRLSQIIAALRWPKQFEALGDWPANNNKGWQNDPQGLAQDGITWFIARVDALLTVPTSTNLQDLDDSHFSNRHSPIPLGSGAEYSLASNEPDLADYDLIQIDGMPGYNHLSALAIHRLNDRSILYIPAQYDKSLDSNPFVGHLGGPTPEPIIFAVESFPGKTIVDHKWRAVIPQPQDTDQGAWCAYDPVAKRLYSSSFYGGSPGSSVDVYSIGTPTAPDLGDPVPGEVFKLWPIGAMGLFERDGVTPAQLRRIQGGVISDQRHLYLVERI